MSDTLEHHGILGMKWGVRRTPAQLGHKTSTSSSQKRGNKVARKIVAEKRKKPVTKKPPGDENKKNNIDNWSDDELRKRINRLQMEKSYKQLMTEIHPQKQSKGKKFVMDVLEKSGKDLAEQTVKYVLGNEINKVLAKVYGDERAINPKKGQKDK